MPAESRMTFGRNSPGFVLWPMRNISGIEMAIEQWGGQNVRAWYVRSFEGHFSLVETSVASKGTNKHICWLSCNHGPRFRSSQSRRWELCRLLGIEGSDGEVRQRVIAKQKRIEDGAAFRGKGGKLKISLRTTQLRFYRQIISFRTRQPKPGLSLRFFVHPVRC